MNKTIIQATTSAVEVYKVIAPTMEEAFQRLKVQFRLDNYNLSRLEVPEETKMYHGFILKTSKKLHGDYLNNHLSEFTVFGALYNEAPKIKTDEKILLRNIVSRGTKQWETVNSYQTDSGEVLFIDTSTKAEALDMCKSLALEHDKTVNVVLSKRLKDHDGILGVAEVISYNNIDNENVYIFWRYSVTVVEEDEEDSIDAEVVKEAYGQLAIREDLYSYIARRVVNKKYKKLLDEDIREAKRKEEERLSQEKLDAINLSDESEVPAEEETTLTEILHEPNK